MKKLNLSNSQITAASSLLNIGGRIFVCSDDQYSIYEYTDHGWKKFHWNEKPNGPLQKKLKPDFEALIQVDAETILMMPSGSKTNRTEVIYFNINKHSFTSLDLSHFFSKIPSINLEGGAKIGEHLILMNRGVRNQPSSLITAHAQTFSILNIVNIDFGDIGGQPLHGSELCMDEGQLFSLAVAEDSDNSYDDGEILGSVLCQIDWMSGKVVSRQIFPFKIKTEGLCPYKNEWLVVTDPDGTGISEFYQVSKTFPPLVR